MQPVCVFNFLYFSLLHNIQVTICLSSSRDKRWPVQEAGGGGLVVLGVGQLQGAFYLLAMGMLLGLLVVLIEVLMVVAPQVFTLITPSSRPYASPQDPMPKFALTHHS